MKYPWDAFGITHKDLGYNRAGDLLAVVTQKKLVKGEVAKFAGKLGPDPVETMAHAIKNLADVKDKVASGEYHQSILDAVDKGVLEVQKNFYCWQFWTSILAGMEG